MPATTGGRAFTMNADLSDGRGAEPIAIVGMACHLPGGIHSDEDLWEFLVQERSGQCKVPSDRFNIDAFRNPQSGPDSISMEGGYFIQEDLRLFENSFFGINNLEAAGMDPQQRKLLEVCFECIETAGIRLDDISGARVGCYVANFTSDFQNIQLKDPGYLHRLAALGYGPTILSNRISYAFDLKGPSLTLDTACSSSLYCLHLAVRALRQGDCDAAFVAGTNLILSPEQQMSTARLGVLSNTSACHSFSAAADGYGRADGVGALYVKRLSDAIRDGDPIRSIIRGTATNSNGRGNGITMPSTASQYDVIQSAYADAGLSKDATDYVECHGTGTQIGDPIEVAAVSEYFRSPRDSPPSPTPIYIGSVKTNLGHSEAASGITSVIKATLALEHQWIPATIGASDLNPNIPWHINATQVVRAGMPWPKSARSQSSHRISINSFGYGGSNAHCILEDFVPRNPTLLPGSEEAVDDRMMIYPLSAATEFSLRKRLQDLAKLDHTSTSIQLADIAHTLIERRTNLACRGFVIAQRYSWSQALQLDRFEPTISKPKLADPNSTPVAFIFTGQGAQWATMGRHLYANFLIFRQTVQYLDLVLNALPNPPETSLQSMLCDAKHSSAIHQPEFSQPACTAIQIALVNLLQEWNVMPRYVIGHSSGEIAAAYAANYISAAAAIVIAYGRGTVVSDLSVPGAMLSVGMSAAEADTAIHDADLEHLINVACVNSPENVTLSGDEAAIDLFSARLASTGLFARKVKTGGKAYHSHHMRMIGHQYEAFLESAILEPWMTATHHNPVTMISSVHARVVEASEVASAAYWRKNLESPVLFKHAIEILATTTTSFQGIELGPHPVLELLVKQTLLGSNLDKEQLSYMPTLVRNKDGAYCLLSLAGRLWCNGYSVSLAHANEIVPDSTGTFRDGHRPRVLHNLPRYKWCYGEPLWNESRLSKEYRFRRFGHDELLGTLIPGMSGSIHAWRNRLSLENVPWLEDHRLGNEVVYPAAAYIAMVVKAVQQIAQVRSQDSYLEIRDMALLRALPLSRGRPIELFTELQNQTISNVNTSTTTWTFVISTVEDDQSSRRATGSITIVPNTIHHMSKQSRIRFAEEPQGVRNWYDRFAQTGLRFGPEFQQLCAIHNPRMRDCFATRVALKALDLPSRSRQSQYDYDIHPTIIDSQLQAILIATTQGVLSNLKAQVPKSFECIQLFPGLNSDRLSLYQSHAQARHAAAGLSIGSAQLVNETGEIIMALSNVSATAYSGSLERLTQRDPMLYVEWVPDLHRLPTGHSQGLAKALVDETDLDNEVQPDDIAGIMRLLHLAAKANCASSIMIATESISIDSIWKLLGGDSTYNLFDTLTLSRMGTNGILEGQDIVQAPVSPAKPTYRSLRGAKFDIIVADGQFESCLRPMLDDYLKEGGLVLYSGNLPDDVQTESFAIVTTAGQDQNLSVLRPCTQPRTLVNGNATKASEFTVICCNQSSPFDDYLCDDLANRFGTAPQRLTLEEVSSQKALFGSTVIFTTELVDPFLTTASKSQLQAVQMIASQMSRIIWVVGGSLLDCQEPEAAAALGLCRALMLEQPATQFQIVGLESPVRAFDAAAECIYSVLQQPAARGKDAEFIQRNGILHVSRCVPISDLNDRFNQRLNGFTQLSKFGDAGQVQLEIESPGQFDTLYFHQQNKSEPVGADCVVVEVKAIGINAKDVYTLSGDIPTHERTFALEYSGVVKKVGSGVADFRDGDRVVVCAPGPFSNVISVPEWACVPMLEAESFTQMATAPVVFMTAIHALIDRARLQKGESVLIHSATGGVGMAAIKVAKMIGAEIFVTAGTSKKREFLKREFGIPEDHVFHSRDLSFLPEIMKVTDGLGVDVVLNSLSGERLHASIEACAMFGRFIEIGKRDIIDAGKLSLSSFSRGLTFSAFDLSEYYYSGTSVGRATWTRLLRQGIAMHRRFPASAPQVFSAGHVHDAVRSFANSSRTGKICVTFEDANALIKMKPVRHAFKFSPTKEYLLVGCLGGLGRSLARYMLENGARNFVFIGRTGTDRPAARALVDNLRSYHAHVRVVRGDVQDYQTVLEAVQGMSLKLGGVVQAAMGLAESLFHSMSHSQWHTSLGPKVRGTWNIHRAIEGRDSQLDFFLMTSSLNGSIGTATESNYCAANSFLDYFAKYRRREGKPATSIGFGLISEVGYLHERPHIQQMLERRGLVATTEAEFLDIVDISLCNERDSPIHRTHQRFAHILTGIEMSNRRSGWDQGYEGAAQDELLDPRLSILMHAERNRNFLQSDQSNDRDALPQPVREAVQSKDSDRITEAVFDCLAAKISQLVLMPVADISMDMYLSRVGMDSMLAAEYRSFIFRTLKADVPFLTLMDSKTSLKDTASLIASQLDRIE